MPSRVGEICGRKACVSYGDLDRWYIESISGEVGGEEYEMKSHMGVLAAALIMNVQGQPEEAPLAPESAWRVTTAPLLACGPEAGARANSMLHSLSAEEAKARVVLDQCDGRVTGISVSLQDEGRAFVFRRDDNEAGWTLSMHMDNAQGEGEEATPVRVVLRDDDCDGVPESRMVIDGVKTKSYRLREDAWIEEERR